MIIFMRIFVYGSLRYLLLQNKPLLRLLHNPTDMNPVENVMHTGVDYFGLENSLGHTCGLDPGMPQTHVGMQLSKTRLLHSPNRVAVRLSDTQGMASDWMEWLEKWMILIWIGGWLSCSSFCISCNVYGTHFFIGHWQSPCTAPMAGLGYSYPRPAIGAVQGGCETGLSKATQPHLTWLVLDLWGGDPGISGIGPPFYQAYGAYLWLSAEGT